MSTNPAGSEYVLQNAILKNAALAAGTGTNASIEQPVVDYAAGKAASDADAVKAANDLNFKKDQMAQQEKQFLTQLLFAHDQLNTWSKQNDLATLLSAAAIPGQIVSMNNQSNSLDKQNALTKELIDSNKGNVNAVNLASAARTKEFQDYQDNQKNLLDERAAGYPSVRAAQDATTKGLKAIRKY